MSLMSRLSFAPLPSAWTSASSAVSRFCSSSRKRAIVARVVAVLPAPRSIQPRAFASSTSRWRVRPSVSASASMFCMGSS